MAQAQLNLPGEEGKTESRDVFQPNFWNIFKKLYRISEKSDA